MLKRNKSFLIRLSQDELTQLNNDVEKTGLSRESYVRSLINGYIPAARPSNDFQKVLYFLRITSNNLNQIAQKAHVLHVVDVQRYDKEVRKFEETVRRITEAVILPEKIESGNRGDQ